MANCDAFLLIGVLAAQIRFHRGYCLRWFWLGCATARCLRITITAVESVDLLDVHFTEAHSLTELAASSFVSYFLNGVSSVLKVSSYQ